MKLRLQAALAVAVAVAPLTLGVIWNDLGGAAERLSGAAALGLALAGAGLVGLLWTRDMRRLLAGDPAALPVHATLGARIAQHQEQAEVATRLAESRAAAASDVLDALPDPVVSLDGTGGTPRPNQAARALFGAAGELPALLRHPALREGMDRAGTTRQAQQVELVLAVPMERLLSAWIVPVDLTDRAGPIRTLVVLRDRTREAGLERMRADFVANASHELRTPLASLIGFIETLRGPAEGDVAAQRRFLAIMHEQAERMRRLLDDLLSLSQIEMVEHAPPTGSVDAGAVVRRVAEEFEPRLAARAQALELDIEPELPSIPADEDQLSQVVMNLLDNAVKYGREGGTIRIRVGRVAPATGTAKGPRRPGIAIAVADDGAGIAPEHIPRLTERFYRVDAGRSRAVGGTGLGLAIVKHIVNRHRGRLEIDSTPGQGAVFTVWLPEAGGQ